MRVNEYEEIVLDCEYSILSAAKNDSPGSHISWLKDGFRISERMKLANVDINETKLSKEQQTKLHHLERYL